MERSLEFHLRICTSSLPARKHSPNVFCTHLHGWTNCEFAGCTAGSNLVFSAFHASKLPVGWLLVASNDLNLERSEMAKIVVTDDDQDIRAFLQAVLEGQGHTVVAAADRDEGMQAIESEKPDLIMLDVMMAGWQDGFEMARELKGDSRFKDTPILMLTGIREQTGMGFDDTAGDPTWCPVDGFLEKPVHPDALLKEVAKLLPQDD